MKIKTRGKSKYRNQAKTHPPLGSQPLERGEAGIIRLANLAIKKLGEDHEIVKELIRLELAIATGKNSHRYVGFELKAIIDTLDRLIGKPRQPVDANVKLSLAELVEASLKKPKDGR